MLGFYPLKVPCEDPAFQSKCEEKSVWPDMSATVESHHAGGDEAAGESGRRMIITKISIENFKSYAGLVEIGPLHKVRLL